MVLDFANEAEGIRSAFEPYYETTLLSEATDPNLLYQIQTRLAAFPVYTETDVDAFAKVYFDPKVTQDRLYAALAPVVERSGDFTKTRHEFRGQLTDYVRLYAVLAQVLTVFLRWKGVEAAESGDFFVRSGPGTVRLSEEDVAQYVRTRFNA